MNVIMLAAGAGTRMNSTVPKPFIRVDGKPMWMRVAQKLGFQERPDVQKTLVLQEKHRCYLDYRVADDSDYINDYFDDVVYIRDMGVLGPAWSVAAATLSTFHESSAILIVDSDCWVEIPKNAPAYMIHQGCLGGMTEFEQILNMRPHWETDCIVFGVRTLEDVDHAAEITLGNGIDTVVRVREGGVKKGGLLNVGAYWFRSLTEFRHRLQRCAGLNSEVKLSDLVNTASRGVSAITLNGNFVNIGTAELLAKYKEQNGEAN